MKKILATLVVCAAMSLGLGVKAHAGDEVVTKGEANGKVNAEALGKLLRDMGYEVRTTRSGEHTFHYLKVKSGELEFHIQINLSYNGEFLWFKKLTEAPKDKDLAARMALRLLEEHHKTGASHFRYDPKSNFITLHRAVYNRAITAAVMREGVDELVDTSLRTRGVWDEAQFKASLAPATKEPQFTKSGR